MEIISMLVTGLLIGALARAVVPGTAGMGCLPTIAVGVAGAFVGGLIGQGIVGDFEQSGLLYLLFSVLGAILVLLLLQAIAGRGRASRRRY